MQRYMVVERFRPGCTEAVYDRLNASGRMLPDGLYYLSFWVNKDQGVCFQLMETDDFYLFTPWRSRWEDIVDFAITPVDPVDDCSSA